MKGGLLFFLEGVGGSGGISVYSGLEYGLMI